MNNNLEVQQDALAENAAATIYDRIAQHKVTDIDSYLLMAELTKEVKKVVNKFEEETRPEIDQAHKLHKALIARKKKWADKFDGAEALAKEKIRHFLETFNGHVPKVDGISSTETWAGEVVDASLIPREYLTPDLDKLRNVTKALKGELSIPGWQVRNTKSISVRL
jgi:galactokinase